MTPFMTEDFLLDTEFARRLYHDYAKDQPIFDYHCHLPPQQIAEDYRFKNLYDIWLKGDHYKWRAMRTNGVAERLCTGDASDREKFDAWAATVPHTIGNPLYHWTHLELRRPFGITGKLLSPSTADEIWNECNELLAQDNFSARGIMQQMNVKMVGTTMTRSILWSITQRSPKTALSPSKCCRAGVRTKPSTSNRRPLTTTWRSWAKFPIPTFAALLTCKLP